MKRCIQALCGISCLLVVCFSSVYAEITFSSAEEATKVADDYFDNKSFTEKERSEIMQALMQAADKWPNDYQLQWRAARAIHAYADAKYYQFRLSNYEKALRENRIDDVNDVLTFSEDMLPEQGKILLALGIQARTYADRAVQLDSRGVDGHYFNALAISIYAYGKSIIKALLEGLGPKYEQHLNDALSVNKNYKGGQLFAAYGRYWYSLPWPKRDAKKSLDDLLTAYQQDPTDILVLDFLGDTYFILKQKNEAKRMWEECLRSQKRTYRSEIIQKLVQAKLQYL